MKKFKFLAIALAAITVISCSKDDNKGANGEAPDGTPIYASLSIKFDPSTRTEEGATEEGIVAGAKAAVLVYKNGVLESRALDLTFENGLTSSFGTTTGPKDIVAIVNLPTGVTLPALNTPINDLYVLKATIASSPIAEEDKFVMSGLVKETLVAAGGATVNVAITVKRLAAKVGIVIADGIPMNGVLSSDKANATFTKVGAATASDIVPGFALQLTQKYAHIYTKETNPFTTPGALSTPEKPTIGKYENIQTTFGLPYANARNSSEGAATFLDSRYAPANYNVVQTVGNSTFAAIKVQLLPKNKIVVAADKNVTYTPHTFTTTSGFFGFVHADITYAPFESKVTAETAYKIITATEVPPADGIIKEWKNGVAYYKIYVGDRTGTELKQKYSILANSVYKINVAEISGFGVSKEEDLIDPNPEDPIETSVNITATITVADWDLVAFSEGIQ